MALPLPREFNITVLIETYWNVNKTASKIMIMIFSLNRNILECKCGYVYGTFTLHESLNRNILECKYSL